MRRTLATVCVLALLFAPLLYAASGDTLLVFEPAASSPAASNFGTFDTRNNHIVLDFDATTDETVYFAAVLPRNYGSSGTTVTIVWMASTATTGTTRWEVAWERHDTATDLDSDSFASTQSAGGSAPGTLGYPAYTAVTFTDGAQMDSTAAGEHFRLLVRRDADGTTGTDDMAGDAELLGIEIKET
jgi:hypothetical protein